MMSVTQSMDNNITFGSLSLINKTSINIANDSGGNTEGCVIHYINYGDNNECDEIMNKDITTEDIGLYISDQHYELWGIMKRGDMVEDVNSGKRFIVDRQYNQSSSIKIIRNGLTIRDMYTEIFDEGTIIPSFYSITEFPLRYFDNAVINNLHDINYESKKYIIPSPISFDIDRLGLNNMNDMYCELINSDQEMLIFKLVEYEVIRYIVGIVRSNDIEGCGREHYIIEYIEHMEDNKMFRPRYIYDEDGTFDKIIKKYNVERENVVVV